MTEAPSPEMSTPRRGEDEIKEMFGLPNFVGTRTDTVREFVSQERRDRDHPA